MKIVSASERYVDAWNRRAEFHGIEIIDLLAFDRRNRNVQKIIIYGGLIAVQVNDRRAIAWLYSAGCLFDADGIRRHRRVQLAEALQKIGMLSNEHVQEEKVNRTALIAQSRTDEAAKAIKIAVDLIGVAAASELLNGAAEGNDRQAT